jgi:Ca2+-binding RTX toxin-like protein
MTRCTTAAVVTLALVGAWATSAPSSVKNDAVGGRDATLGAGSVQVPVTPDDGGHVIGADGAEHDGEFALAPGRWRKNDLTYGFINHTSDLSVAAQEAAIASAMRSWGSYTQLTFTEVPDCGLAFNHVDCTTPDIRIAFASGNHGDGPDIDPFDGPGGTAAHGFYPPPNGRSAAGDLHFDDAERWSTSGSGVDLESVALHELGHALGLLHASALQCPLRAGASRPIMCGTIIGADRTVAQDDINGIQALYGRPANACAGRAVTVDLAEGQRPTSGADVIAGTAGDDVIAAGGGADIVCSGAGNDRVDLGPGSDRADTGAGADVVHGRTGADRIEGGAGNDRVYAGADADQLFGGGGGDTLDGGTGGDKLYGGLQGDNCNGRGGRDRSTGCELRLGIEALLR